MQAASFTEHAEALPVGSTTFVMAFMETRLQRAEDYMARIRALPQRLPPSAPGVQMAMLWARVSLGRRIQHLARGVLPDCARPAL
eukprot:8621386-Prorocentrum_lima.AAC.1